MKISHRSGGEPVRQENQKSMQVTEAGGKLRKRVGGAGCPTADKPGAETEATVWYGSQEAVW